MVLLDSGLGQWAKGTLSRKISPDIPALKVEVEIDLRTKNSSGLQAPPTNNLYSGSALDDQGLSLAGFPETGKLSYPSTFFRRVHSRRQLRGGALTNSF